MEHHTAASMYIPSSTVLAQLNRQTGAPGRPQGGTRAPPTGSKVFGRSKSGGTHPRACTDATKSSGAAEATKAVKSLCPVPHGTPSGHQLHLGASTPSESTVSAAALAHCTVSDAATPPEVFMPCAAPPLLFPQTSGCGSSGAVQHRLASTRPTSVWLLPQADAEYILSSLTWNVDLLLLLLSHASCPLHLPEAEPLAEAPVSTVTSLPTARSPTVVTASSTTLFSSPTEEGEATADTPRKKSAVPTTAMDSKPNALAEMCAPSSSPASMVYADAANVEKEACSSFMAVKDAASNPRSPSLSSVLTTNVGEDEAPPAAAATLRLTWSEYLFGAARSRVSAAEGAPAKASTRILRSTLPHSRSDGELMTCTNPPPGKRLPSVTNTISSTSLSIFHAQYLPSLEEFERQLEAHKHRQQQQQQHPPTLSVTRLEQHLQQQQQQHHRHRRAATNKTFFYSPTPSVISLATTCANMTVNTKAREEGDAKDGDDGEEMDNEEEEKQQQRGRRTTAATSEPSLCPSNASRLSLSHAQPSSIIMSRAVDQPPALILSTSAAKLSPQLQHSSDGDLGYPICGTSPRATTADGGRAEEEEGTTSRLSSSDRCSVGAAGSPLASPTVSIHSMSQSCAWSRTVSGRGTPQATLSTRLSCSALPPYASLIHSSCTPVSNASPYSTAKGGRNARRRRKTKCTRRPRAMRVYVPSITEGPKAASLYAAPTAEAHELLLLLQRKKTTAAAVGLCASTTTSSVMQPSSQSSTASAGVWVPGQPPLELQPLHPRSALTAETKLPRPPPPQRASRSGAGSAIVYAATASSDSASHEQCPDRPPSLLSPPLSASRCLHPHPCQRMPTVAQTEVHLSSDWAASSMRSHATPNDSLSSSWSGIMTSLLPAATAMPTHAWVSTSPVCRGESGAGASENSTRVSQGRDAPVGAGTAHASGKTDCGQSGALACTTAPTAPVELPQWVRERPLSALYYQPWGLELLARYEAACHEQQQLMRGGTTRREDPATNRRASAASSAVSGTAVVRDRNTPPIADKSKVANNFTSHGSTSLSASSTASQRTPVSLCSFLGASDGGSNKGTAVVAAASAAPGKPLQSSDRPLGVSWAEALRQQQPITGIPGRSDALGSTEATTAVRSNKITATTTMNNSTTIRSATAPRQLPATAWAEWPAELVAAEEMDAWEENYYFDGPTMSPLEPLKQPHKPTPSRPAATPLMSGVAESAVVAPSASSLNKQRRPSRRRSRATYSGDSFRSSAARRAGATSAAAEVLHKRRDNNTAVTAAAPTCVGPISDKVTAPLEASYPPITKSPPRTCVPLRGAVTPHDGDEHTHKHAAGLATPISFVQRTGKRDGTVENTQQKMGRMRHAARGTPSKAEMREPQLGDNSHDHAGTPEATAPGSGMPWPTRLSADGAQRASAHPTRSSADVDVFFFLQMFMRAVLIVFIAQVRLQQRRGEEQASASHDMTCPVAAYLLEQQALAQPIGGGHLHGYHSDPGDRGATTSHASDESSLSVLERRALSFVRNYMEDYRSMITACVMRDSREVARRSAQSIFHPAPSATSSSSMAAAAIPGASDTHADTATDPLFRQDVFTRLLNANRVNTAYREAVRAATGGLPGASPATSLDDVESLRTAQVYISGKDAAWQPLLMELLQVSRVVQCYGDGPVVSASGAPSAKPSASAASPQRHLLSSLERFLAHPTRPLFRPACPTAPNTAQEPAAVRERATAPSAGTSTAMPGHPASNVHPTTTPSLTPAQAKAAALMIEESDAFRSYLLSRYIKDDTAAAAAAAAAAVTPATPLTLRHSHSAPTLSVREAQQWQESSVTTAAAITPTSLADAVDDHQRHPPTSSSGAYTAGSVLQPLTWYPYAYMPGTANPYAESTNPACASKSPAQASTASAMTLSVAMLPLSGRLLWRWVVPAEDTDTYNLSVFFQSSLFSFMQGGPVPMPSAAPGQVAEWHWASAAADGVGAAVYVPTPSVKLMAPPPHPSLTWPRALAARIDEQLRSEAFRSDWGEVPPPCMCNSAVTALSKDPASHACLWSEAPEVVLVHCSAGMHRSCGILVAFLLWLLYQCREVLRAEQALICEPPGLRRAPLHTHSGDAGVADEAAVRALLVDNTDAPEHEAASAEDDTYQSKQHPPCVPEKSADADAPWLTSRLLQRIIRHVQQRRNIAVPIRTVQFLLQSFANELQLN